MNIGAGLSTSSETTAAAREATERALVGLEGRRPDLAVVFASPHHAPAASELLEEVHRVADPAGAIGCVGEAIVGGEREIEGEPAVSVWLGALPGGAETFHMEFDRTPSGGALSGLRLPDGQDLGVVVAICDPFSFPAELLLAHLNERLPGIPVVGGMASGAREPGRTVLFRDREVQRTGAVGAYLRGGVPVRAFVSQGCRPVGESYVVTRADRNLLIELGGRKPLERLQELAASLAPPDRELVSQGLHLGRVIDEYKPEHGLGDFLIRGVVGADPESGAIAVGDELEVGQTVRFHVRDAATADEELRSLLERSRAELPGPAAGALLFTCNGRGSRLFPSPDHDAGLVSSAFGSVPLAGFFCAGELGPVGGRNFLHGFTASVLVFVDDARGGRGRGAEGEPS